MQRTSSESFADARQQKREIFQSRWNQFIQNGFCYVLLGLLLAAQVAVFLSAIGFLRQQIIFLSKPGRSHPLWYDVAIALFLSLPGFGFWTGLWKICRNTRWHGDDLPDISGFKLIKLTNTIVWIISGMILALYPTIIITAGEYMMDYKILRLFYLLIPFVLLFAVCVSLVRIAIRKAEENLTCCWSDTGCLFPLVLILAGVVAAVLIFSERTLFFCSVAALAAVYGAFLLCWWLFLRKTAIRQAAIDHKIIVSRENPDDPYNRY